ncbi:MAG: PEGA domain-containing protein, partial [Vicinamibacterales bacterium]
PAPKGEGSAGEHAQPRSRAEQPPRRGDVPNRYFRGPHVYAFPPVDLRVGFYYHPYFGFYYGPYYGPFYPYPGPFPRLTRYGTSSVRLRVQPVEAEVYLNGYYAGIVDDFDGVFQRLYVPAGPHKLELRLPGYESYHQDVYVQPGDTLEVRHEMRRMALGVVAAPPPRPQPLPSEWTTTESSDAGEGPATPYGVLAIRTDPTDAQVVIDGEAWATVAGQREFTIHLAAGWHTLEVRKDSYRTFSTSVEMSEGRTTRLSVELKP